MEIWIFQYIVYNGLNFRINRGKELQCQNVMGEAKEKIVMFHAQLS